MGDFWTKTPGSYLCKSHEKWWFLTLNFFPKTSHRHYGIFKNDIFAHFLTPPRFPGILEPGIFQKMALFDHFLTTFWTTFWTTFYPTYRFLPLKFVTFWTKNGPKNDQKSGQKVVFLAKIVVIDAENGTPESPKIPLFGPLFGPLFTQNHQELVPKNGPKMGQKMAKKVVKKWYFVIFHQFLTKTDQFLSKPKNLANALGYFVQHKN